MLLRERDRLRDRQVQTMTGENKETDVTVWSGKIRETLPEDFQEIGQKFFQGVTNLEKKEVSIYMMK